MLIRRHRNVTEQRKEERQEVEKKPKTIDEMSYNQLRKLAKKKGIELGKNPPKDVVIEALKEGE